MYVHIDWPDLPLVQRNSTSTHHSNRTSSAQTHFQTREVVLSLLLLTSALFRSLIFGRTRRNLDAALCVCVFQDALLPWASTHRPFGHEV